jgi:hypothetical protein
MIDLDEIKDRAKRGRELLDRAVFEAIDDALREEEEAGND